MSLQTLARRERRKAARENSQEKNEDGRLDHVLAALVELKETNSSLVKQVEILNVKMGELQNEVQELNFRLANAQKVNFQTEKEEATESSDDGAPRTPRRSNAKDDDDVDDGEQKDRLVPRGQRKELERDTKQDARMSKQEDDGGETDKENIDMKSDEMTGLTTVELEDIAKEQLDNGPPEEGKNISKQDKATAERSDIHEPVVRRDPSDAWTAKFLKRFDRALRRKDDLSEKEKEKLQKIDEEEHNEEAHEE